MKKVSILLPYFNDADYLAESINSVLAQSHENWELILINHACTDQSETIAKSYTDHRIHHVRLEHNMGAGGGLILKAFLEKASGDYFKSHCADDVMKPNCVKTLVDFLEKEKADFVFGNMEFINSAGELTGQNWFDYKKVDLSCDFLAKFLKGTSLLPYPAALVQMKALRSILINYTMYGMFDMTIWTQLLTAGLALKCTATSVTQYRIHENQISSSSQRLKMARMTAFEMGLFCEFFYRIRLDLLKKILKDDVFVQKADKITKEFVIAHHFSGSGSIQRKLHGLQRISSILQNDNLRELIQRDFGYTIADLRKSYNSANLFGGVELSEVKTSKLIKELKRRLKAKFSRKKKLEVL